jgi:hypothetical protein
VWVAMLCGALVVSLWFSIYARWKIKKRRKPDPPSPGRFPNP